MSGVISAGVTLTPERPRLVLPGLLPADPALEHYRVHPGAVTAVELEPGDVLTVVDV
jgi:glycine cleavage system T protein (aminomethyltransferase)